MLLSACKSVGLLQGDVSRVPRPATKNPARKYASTCMPRCTQASNALSRDSETCPQVHDTSFKDAIHSKGSSAPSLSMARGIAAAHLFIRVCGFVGFGSILMAPSARAQPPTFEPTTTVDPTPNKPPDLEVAKYRILQVHVNKPDPGD